MQHNILLAIITLRIRLIALPIMFLKSHQLVLQNYFDCQSQLTALSLFYFYYHQSQLAASLIQGFSVVIQVYNYFSAFIAFKQVFLKISLLCSQSQRIINFCPNLFLKLFLVLSTCFWEGKHAFCSRQLGSIEFSIQGIYTFCLIACKFRTFILVFSTSTQIFTRQCAMLSLNNQLYLLFIFYRSSIFPVFRIFYNKNSGMLHNKQLSTDFQPNSLDASILKLNPKHSIKRNPSNLAIRRQLSKDHVSQTLHCKQKYLINHSALNTPLQKSYLLSSLIYQKSLAPSLQKKKKLKQSSSTTNILHMLEKIPKVNEKIVKVYFIVNNNTTLTYEIDKEESLKKLKGDFVLKILTPKLKLVYSSLLGFEAQDKQYSLNYCLNNENQLPISFFLKQGSNELKVKVNLAPQPVDYKIISLKDFEIKSFLGNGGFSTVFLAKCLLNHKYTALKLINKNSLTSQKKVKMLENQLNILLSLNHPQLINLYYAFQTKNFIILGLQYCPYGNLYTYLKQKQFLPEQEAKSMFRQVLEGVQYLHEKNILFRDIKLENILFDIRKNIKITDFGLSKPDVDNDEITYSYCGSPQYMAPEMIIKSGHSYQVDYYSLGILLYELLYGKSPFYAQKKEDIFNGILNNSPEFPENPIVSDQAKNMILGLLQKNPKRRIGSLKGIKQILCHPWLRNYQLKLNQQICIQPIRVPKRNQDQIIKKMKSMLQYQKKTPMSMNKFLQQSYVNVSLASENIINFRTIKNIRKSSQLKQNNKPKMKKSTKKSKFL